MHAYQARGNRLLTGGEQDKGGSGVDNTSSSRENGSRTVLDGLVDTPVLVSWGSRRGRAIQLYVSNEILHLSSWARVLTRM